MLLLVIVRPLLFTSIDPDVAAARGLPVRVLGLLFLAIVGATAGDASQAVGALVLTGLLAAVAAAQHLTSRPWPAFAFAGALAVTAMWLGITMAYTHPDLAPHLHPAVATAEYALAALTAAAAATANNAGPPAVLPPPPRTRPAPPRKHQPQSQRAHAGTPGEPNVAAVSVVVRHASSDDTDDG